MKKNIDIFKSRKVKYGAATTTTIILFAAAVVVFNMIMNTLSEKVNTSFDLTENKVFNLTEDSKKFLSKLDQNVEIVILSDENEFESIDNKYTKQANKVIKQYARTSDKINIKYVNVIKDPTYLSTYSDEQITKNSVIVKTENKHRVLSLNDLFDIEQGYYGGGRIIASKAENAVTSAIVNVTSKSQTKVALIKGYAEDETASIVNLLQSNNFEVEEVPILTKDIPSDASAAILFGPGRDLDARGIEKINKFMDNKGEHGKNLFIALNADNSTYTNVNKLLDPYGVKVGDGIVFETDPSFLVSNLVFQFVSSIVPGKYSENLKNSSIPVYSPASVSLEISDEENVQMLLQTSIKAGIKPFKSDSNWKIDDGLKNNSLATGLVSNKNDSKVFVFGSSMALGSDALKASSLNNSSYFLNLFNTFKSEEDFSTEINIESTSLEGKSLGLKENQKRLMCWIFVIIIPLIIVVLGIVVIMNRKKKSKIL